MKKLITPFLTGLFLLGCEALPEENDDVIDSPEEESYYWRDMHQCDRETIGQYIEMSMCLVLKHHEDIVNRIEENIAEEYREVPPDNVLKLMGSRTIEYNCAYPKVENVLATWSGTEHYVTLNEDYVMDKYYNDFEGNTDFFKNRCNLDYDKIEDYMLEHPDGIFNGFQDIYNQVRSIYISAVGLNLGNVIVHEHTHAAWQFADLPYHHEDPIIYEEDPFYQYGWGVYELDPVFYQQIGKEIKDMKDELIELFEN